MNEIRKHIKFFSLVDIMFNNIIEFQFSFKAVLLMLEFYYRTKEKTELIKKYIYHVLF